MNSHKLVAALIGAGILAGATAWYYWHYWRPGTVAVPAPPPPMAARPSTPAPVQPEPVVRFPVPEAPDSEALPPLAASDSVALQLLEALYGSESLRRFFHLDNLVRRFVATIDNLPRQTTAQRLMPVKPVPGAFVVARNQGGVAVAPDNALRYRPHVQLMEAVEAKRLVTAYVRLYPLFQAAYQELGYPGGHFNDRLVTAIDDLLGAPDIATPALVQPKVMYQFADPGLEALSAGQKMMIRMGGANAARVKAKLRAIRAELVATR